MAQAMWEQAIQGHWQDIVSTYVDPTAVEGWAPQGPDDLLQLLGEQQAGAAEAVWIPASQQQVQPQAQVAAAAAAAEAAAPAATARPGRAAQPAAAGKKPARKPRKATDAQRAAQKRFRMRRKQLVQDMEAQAAAKQAQLQELEEEHAALQAKARALDQMLASAGDNMALLQRSMEQLALQVPAQGQHDHDQSLPPAPGRLALPLAHSADTSCTAGTTGTTAALSGSGPSRSSSSGGSDSSSEASTPGTQQPAAQLEPSLACRRSPSAASTAALSFSRLESAVYRALGRVVPVPALELGQLAPLQLNSTDEQQLRLQSALPRLQRLFKSLIAEIGQLHVAAGLERHGAASSPAAARLLSIQQQVMAEFRSFAATNRISLYQLKALNMDTGESHSRPPPEHYARAAQLLRERLDAATLSQVVVACKVHLETLGKIKAERSALLPQLQAALTASAAHSSDFSSDSIRSWICDSRVASHDLLDAIDTSLRKEHVVEGVAQWTYHRLLPPFVMAELLVFSYPWLPDCTGILSQLLPPSAAPDSVEQQPQPSPQQPQPSPQQPQPQLAAQQPIWLLAQPPDQAAWQQLQLLPYQQQQPPLAGLPLAVLGA